MKKITEQECEEELRKITGISPKKTISTPNVKEIENIDYDGILIDHEDLQTVLFNRDFIIYSQIEIMNVNMALQQMKQLVENFKAKGLAFSISDGILVYFTHTHDIETVNFANIMEVVHCAMDENSLPNDINVYWGSKVDNKLESDSIQLDIFVSYKAN